MSVGLDQEFKIQNYFIPGLGGSFLFLQASRILGFLLHLELLGFLLRVLTMNTSRGIYIYKPLKAFVLLNTQRVMSFFSPVKLPLLISGLCCNC